MKELDPVPNLHADIKCLPIVYIKYQNVPMQTVRGVKDNSSKRT